MQTSLSSSSILNSIDHWTASSLLQKAIRRSDSTLAERSISRLLDLRGVRALRRLVIIAIEDIGAGSLELVLEVISTVDRLVKANSLSTVRSEAIALAGRMARADKDRSADYLYSIASWHPRLQDFRDYSTSWARNVRDQYLSNIEVEVCERAFLAISASGKAPTRSDLIRNLSVLSEAGAGDEVVRAAQCALKITSESFCVLLPILAMEFREKWALPVLSSLPETTYVGDVPMYVFDKHTSIGKASIAQFSRSITEVKALLERLAPKGAERDVANIAAFYADAYCTKRTVKRLHLAELESDGIEADLAFVGASLGGVAELRSIFSKHLGQLNEMRAKRFKLRLKGH